MVSYSLFLSELLILNKEKVFKSDFSVFDFESKGVPLRHNS